MPWVVVVAEMVKGPFTLVPDAVEDEVAVAVVVKPPPIQLPVLVVVWLDLPKLVAVADWL